MPPRPQTDALLPAAPAIWANPTFPEPYNADGALQLRSQLLLDPPDVPPIVLIVSTQRGASTETAEAIGSHPCAASLNEALYKPEMPVGYEKYNRRTDFYRELHVSFHHDTWLEDALKAREAYCDARPAEVKQACGSACAIVLKMHLNQMLHAEADPSWLRLVTSNHARAIVVERDAFTTFCSIAKVKECHDWGHTPDTHRSDTRHAKCRENFRCEPSDKSRKFEDSVHGRFAATRSALRAANRSALEMPFDRYVENTTAAELRMLDFVGLRVPPPEWRDTCTYSWCANYSWPSPK